METLFWYRTSNTVDITDRYVLIEFLSAAILLLENQACSSKENAPVTVTPDVCRSNLRNSLSPYYCSIWDPDEVHVVYFLLFIYLFITQNHICESLSGIFKEDTLLSLTNRYEK